MYFPDFKFWCQNYEFKKQNVSCISTDDKLSHLNNNKYRSCLSQFFMLKVFFLLLRSYTWAWSQRIICVSLSSYCDLFLPHAASDVEPLEEWIVNCSKVQVEIFSIHTRITLSQPQYCLLSTKHLVHQCGSMVAMENNCRHQYLFLASIAYVTKTRTISCKF